MQPSDQPGLAWICRTSCSWSDHDTIFMCVFANILSSAQYLGLRPAMASASSQLHQTRSMRSDQMGLVQLHSPSSSVSVSLILGCCFLYSSFAGLGIDDMFALVTTLQNLTELEMMLPREEKVGLVGDHYHFNLLTRLSGDEACWCRHHHHHFDRPGCLRHWSLLQSLFCQVSELCSISFLP